MSDYLVRITKWLGYFLALLVIVAATLVSVGRLLTPYLNQHKADFEGWATQLLHAPVHIGEVRISWHGYSPQLTFSKVTILDNKTHKPTFNIRQIKINAKIAESLIKREPVLSYIKISGMDLTIHTKKSGAFNIAGFGDIAIADNLLGGVHEANEVVAWMFSQPALALSDIHIMFYTLAGIKKSITVDELSLLNANKKHLLAGKGTLNQDIPTHVELALDWRGDSLDLATVTANLYLYVEGIYLPQWLKQQTWKNIQVKEGLGSAKIWLEWSHGQLQKVQTQLQIYRLSIYSLTTLKTQTISRLSGNLGWKREGKNQVIAGNDILIDLPQHLWPTTSFSLTLPLQMTEHQEGSSEPIDVNVPPIELTLDSKLDTIGLENNALVWQVDHQVRQDPVSVRASYVDLKDLYLLTHGSGLLPEHLENILASLKPSGEIMLFTLDFKDSTSIENNKMAAKFSNLSWEPWQKNPGVSGLSGAFEWNGKKGFLNVNSKSLQLVYSSALEAPVLLGKLSGRFQFQKDKKETWSFKGKKLAVSNDDLQINMDVTGEKPEGETIKIDLMSKVEVKNVTNLIHYLPLKIMDPELSRWFLQAFHGGKFVGGKLVIQGRMSDFPFANQNGKFSMIADAKDVDFGFALGWPSLKNVNGSIEFAGRSMVVDIKSGSLQGMSVKNLRAEIPYIGKPGTPHLKLDGMIDGNLAQAMQVIKQSPLKIKLSKEVNDLQVEGPLQLKLNADIPLKKAEQSQIIGDMTLTQAAISMPSSNMIIDHVTGVLHFTEKSLDASGVTARLWGEPITLQIRTEYPKNASQFVNFQLNGLISDSIVHTLTQNTPYAKIIQGGAAYQATLKLPQNQLSEPAQLTIESDLKGVMLDLPPGLSKKTEEIIPFKIITTLKQNKPLEVKLLYGNKLTAAAIVKNTATGRQFYSAELRLSSNGFADFQTLPGVLISGQFDTLDWNVWKTYFANMSGAKSNQTDAHILSLFRGLDIRANKIIGIFQDLNKVHFEVHKSVGQYTLKLDSVEIAGMITLPIKAKDSRIKATFSRLYLNPTRVEGNLLDPNTLPAIIFMGNDVRYKNKKLGQVKFDIVPIKDGVAIESVRLNSDLFNLGANGEWLLKENKSSTYIQGKLTTPDVAKFLSHWGSPTVNPEGSGGTVTFDLHWPNAVYRPTLPGLTGKIDLDITEGRIINLDQATNAKMGFGRILNILSLDSISRALTFNFKGLTEQGYSFDSMKGHIILKDGSAYTDDVRIDGSIARIEMSGRLGMAAKDYDIKLSVTPFMTGSIPVVAALAVNPIVGIAVWAVEKIAGKAVSSATTHKYEVTGTWDKPVWVDK